MPPTLLVSEPPRLTAEQTDDLLESLADSFRSPLRSPLMRTPRDYGLDYENVTFRSMDGVPLEGWFIPASGSDRVIITNHPLWFNRSGLPAHLEPWKSLCSNSGNDFEVDFIEDYRILHDAGYNVLAYDLRNCGQSADANGGIVSSGIFEARDVVGSIEYVYARHDTCDMAVALFSRCLGFNASLFALANYPEPLDDLRCLVGPQPLSPRAYLSRALENAGVPQDRLADLDTRVRLRTGFSLDDMSPVTPAAKVRAPTFIYQVRDDLLTYPSDVQDIYDNIPIAEKRLHWIDGTTRRWDGYTHFADAPDQVLDWLDVYMR
jgi:uncharacterized protein